MRCARFLLLLTVLACSDEERDYIERSEYVDEGSLCVSTSASGELGIDVIVDGCASGCASVVASACEVDVGNGEIVVHSSIHVEELRDPNGICPTVCVPVRVSCAPMQATPGEYVFRHGGNVSAARLPTDGALLLGGGGPRVDPSCG